VVKLRVITVNALQETLHRRVLYIVLFLAIVVVGIIASESAFLRMATVSGEKEMAASMAAQTVRQVLGIWRSAAFFLALFLGAIGISGEISSRTIVHILSRPVERWVYLLGRWLGLLIFLWGFFLVGVAAALIFAAVFHVPYTPVIWLGFAQDLAELTFYSGVGLAFSVFMPPVLAGGCALMLTVLPAMLHNAMQNPNVVLHSLALLAYYIAPAQQPDDLIAQSFNKEMLNASYALNLQVMTENLLYVIFVLIIAALIFKRREVQVR